MCVSGDGQGRPPVHDPPMKVPGMLEVSNYGSANDNTSWELCGVLRMARFMRLGCKITSANDDTLEYLSLPYVFSCERISIL